MRHGANLRGQIARAGRRAAQADPRATRTCGRPTISHATRCSGYCVRSKPAVPSMCGAPISGRRARRSSRDRGTAGSSTWPSACVAHPGAAVPAQVVEGVDRAALVADDARCSRPRRRAAMKSPGVATSSSRPTQTHMRRVEPLHLALRSNRARVVQRRQCQRVGGSSVRGLISIRLWALGVGFGPVWPWAAALDQSRRRQKPDRAQSLKPKADLLAQTRPRAAPPSMIQPAA